MLTLISPAKTLDFETEAPLKEYSEITFAKEAYALARTMRKYKSKDLQKMMGVSEAIASLNVDRFKHFSKVFSLENSKQAIYAFKGDVYLGLDAVSFSANEMDYAQSHLRILSGLYGVLAPLDLIQPYRLEMGTRLETRRGTNLYQFWGESITKTLNKQLAVLECDKVVNLASNEYFKAVNTKKLKAEIITPNFKDAKNGAYKMIGFFAKKARGAMAAYIAKNKVVDIEGIKKFDWDGYVFNDNLSKGNELVFTRG